MDENEWETIVDSACLEILYPANNWPAYYYGGSNKKQWTNDDMNTDYYLIHVLKYYTPFLNGVMIYMKSVVILYLLFI